MSTVAVVKKNGFAAIAADTLTTYGTRKVSSTHTRQSGKIIRIGASDVGSEGRHSSQAT